MAAIAKLKLLASRKAAIVPQTSRRLRCGADEDDLPIPSDIKAVFLGGLFLLAMLAACYVAAEIFCHSCSPLCSASYCSRRCECSSGSGVPRGIAAILLIFLLFGTLGGLGTALSGPATSWAQKLPTGIPKLEERLSFLSRPIAAFQKFAEQTQGRR